MISHASVKGAAVVLAVLDARGVRYERITQDSDGGIGIYFVSDRGSGRIAVDNAGDAVAHTDTTTLHAWEFPLSGTEEAVLSLCRTLGIQHG